MVPNSNGHQRRLPSNQHSKIIEFPPTTGGNQGPCRDAGVGEIAPGFAMLKRANALHTLIRRRHLTPLCGGHAPTAERTMNPARMFLESLDRRPGIREQPGSVADIRQASPDVRSPPRKRTSEPKRGCPLDLRCAPKASVDLLAQRGESRARDNGVSAFHRSVPCDRRGSEGVAPPEQGN